jgi:hypothetical protein
MSFITSATMFWHAIAVSGVFSLGFQTTGSPHTHASIAFHAHTATGKVERGDDPDRAQRVPLLHHAMAGRSRGDGQP